MPYARFNIVIHDAFFSTKSQAHSPDERRSMHVFTRSTISELAARGGYLSV